MSLSTTIFHFLLENVFETYQVCYTIFFNTLNLFLFFSTFSVFLNDYFFRWLGCQSLSRFSVLINLFCDLTIFFLYPAVSLVFHGPRFLGSKPRVWVQVLEVAQLQCVYFLTLKKKKYENKSKVRKVDKIHRYTIIKQMLK